MGIAVHVLLHTEEAAVLLHHHAKVHIQHGSVLGEGLLAVELAEVVVYRVLHVSARELLVGRIHEGCGIGGVEVFDTHEPSLGIHLGHKVAVAIDRHYAHYAGGRGNALVIRTERGRDMHYAGAVLGGDIVSGDDLEGLSVRFEPGNQLLIADAGEFRALERAGKNLICDLVVEPGAHELLCQHVDGLLAGVLVGGSHPHIFDLGAYAERGVGRKGPGGGGPGQEIDGGIAEELLGCGITNHLELNGRGGVGHVAVAPGLVQFVRAEPGAVGGAVRLDGVTLIKQALVVYLLEEIPEGLDVAVVVGDVGVVHIYPVTYALRQGLPFSCVFHHLLTAGAVVFFYADLGADIRLGDAEFLLHSQLHGQSVGVPSCAAAHLPTRLALVAADSILDGTCHHVVDARHTVCRRRAFKENVLGLSLCKLQALLESLVFFPALQHTVSRCNQVESLIFFECHNFSLILCLLNSLQI